MCLNPIRDTYLSPSNRTKVGSLMFQQKKKILTVWLRNEASYEEISNNFCCTGEKLLPNSFIITSTYFCLEAPLIWKEKNSIRLKPQIFQCTKRFLRSKKKQNFWRLISVAKFLLYNITFWKFICRRFNFYVKLSKPATSHGLLVAHTGIGSECRHTQFKLTLYSCKLYVIV